MAAVFYWWLLFQKPDQIEVGEDGFRQWDGKTSLKTASVSLWSYIHIPCNLPILHTRISLKMHDMKLTTTSRDNKHIPSSSQPLFDSVLYFHPFPMPPCFPPIFLYSHHSNGYGGHDQHSERMDREPCEVRPLSWCQPVLSLSCGGPRRADPHPGRWGLLALQLPVSSYLYLFYSLDWLGSTLGTPLTYQYSLYKDMKA